MHTPEEQAKAFSRLLDVLATLRVKCPWDRKQTNESLRPNTIEETYELSDALLSGRPEAIREELGDVLLHICFYALMASEKGQFDIADVCDKLREKLVYRHPHVYPPAEMANAAAPTVQTADQVSDQWERLKQHEGKAGKPKGVLAGVPTALPALIKAARIQEKVAHAGFDWPDKEAVWGKVKEEIGEFEAELSHADRDRAEAELGDLLFSLIGVARVYKLDPDTALEHTNRKFTRRFAYIEEEAERCGVPASELPRDEKERLWEEAKAHERGTDAQ